MWFFLSYFQGIHALDLVSNREDRAITLRMDRVETASQHLFVILNISQLNQYCYRQIVATYKFIVKSKQRYILLIPRLDLCVVLYCKMIVEQASTKRPKVLGLRSPEWIIFMSYGTTRRPWSRQILVRSINKWSKQRIQLKHIRIRAKKSVL
jgi:hypothetical protein